MSEVIEDWVCGACGASLGEHPRGIKVNCPVCGKRNTLPGFDSRHQSKGTIAFLAGRKEQAKRHAQEDYKAIRER